MVAVKWSLLIYGLELYLVIKLGLWEMACMMKYIVHIQHTFLITIVNLATIYDVPFTALLTIEDETNIGKYQGIFDHWELVVLSSTSSEIPQLINTVKLMLAKKLFCPLLGNSIRYSRVSSYCS